MKKRIVYELIWEKYGRKEFSLKDVLIVIGILILKVTGMSDSEFQAYLMAVNIKQSTERIPGLANGTWIQKQKIKSADWWSQGSKDDCVVLRITVIPSLNFSP